MTDASEKDPGRGRGNLERDCFQTVIDLFTDKIELPEKILKITPHAVGRLIKEQDNLEKAPSTGAVAANFVRWADYGVVVLGEKPSHIKNFTPAFRKAGEPSLALLDEFKAKHREKLSKARAAERAANAPADKPKAAAKKAPAKKAAAKKAPAKKTAAKKEPAAASA